MSWQASDWVWRHCRLTGIPRFIMLALAHRVFKQKTVTGPTPLKTIVDMTGMGQRTVQRSIDALEKVGDLKVVKTGRRGATHRYELAMQGRFQVLSEPIDPDDSQAPVWPLAVASVTTDDDASSVACVASVSGLDGQCEASERPVSVAEVAGAYVPDPSNVRTESTSERDGSRAAAAPPSRSPSEDGNYAVIERLAIELLTERGGIDGFEDEGDFIVELKTRCARLVIDYGREVSPDVTARAAASARVIYLRSKLGKVAAS